MFGEDSYFHLNMSFKVLSRHKRKDKDLVLVH